MSAKTEFSLTRNAFGRLVLTIPNGEQHEGVVAVRAFPIEAPDEGISLVSAEGHELAWIEQLSKADPIIRQIVSDELAKREFMPVVHRLRAVSTFATPSTWSVDTDRGVTELTLRGEEDIRRVGSDKLLISDSHGIQYLIPDLAALDRHSRRLLDRVL